LYIMAMTAAVTPRELESVRERARVGALVEHPLRLAILRAATSPRSATEIAAGLGLPRQRVNYHIGRLRRAGFLIPADRRRRRGLFEQRYTATARAYLVDPGALGPVQASLERIADRLSAEYLLALSSQVQSDLSRVMGEAAASGKSVATLSISTEVRFIDAEQRARFTRELERVIKRMVGRYAAPAVTADGEPAKGRLFRLVVGCYPPPAREPDV
jgi:DNA-binding transcriptional ArsR family regulator